MYPTILVIKYQKIQKAENVKIVARNCYQIQQEIRLEISTLTVSKNKTFRPLLLKTLYIFSKKKGKKKQLQKKKKIGQI